MQNETNRTSGITYADTGATVRIEIGGAAYANLKAIADAMNQVGGWFDTDNTPVTVLRCYCGDILAKAGECANVNGTFVSDGIADIVNDVLDPETYENTDAEEVRAAFAAARAKLYAAFGWTNAAPRAVQEMV